MSVIRTNNDPRLWELEAQSAYVSLSFLRMIDENDNETWTSLNHISLYIYIQAKTIFHTLRFIEEIYSEYIHQEKNGPTYRGQILNPRP